MNRHEKRRLRTRQKLQAATMELLLEKGYDTLTVQDITDRADLGRGTFYIHFTDKEEIVWSIIETGMVDTERAAQERAAAEGMPDRLAYAAYVNIFRHADENQRREILTFTGITVTGQVFAQTHHQIPAHLANGQVASQEVGHHPLLSAQLRSSHG